MPSVILNAIIPFLTLLTDIPCLMIIVNLHTGRMPLLEHRRSLIIIVMAFLILAAAMAGGGFMDYSWLAVDAAMIAIIVFVMERREALHSLTTLAALEGLAGLGTAMMAVYSLLTYSYASFIVHLVALLIGYIIYLSRRRPAFSHDSLAVFCLCLLLCLTATAVPLTILGITRQSLNGLVVTLLTGGAVVLTLGTAIVYASYLSMQRRQQQLDTLNRDKDRLIVSQKAYYDELVAQYQQLRIYRHEEKAFSTALQQLLRKHDYRQVEKLVAERRLPAAPLTVNCPDVYVASTVNQFVRPLQHDGIDFKFTYDVFAPLAMDKLDICSLFHNLLSNAQQASAKAPCPRSVDLKVSAAGTALRIILSNTVDERHFDMRDIQLGRSTKDRPQDHGLGLAAIRRIVASHGGDIRYSQSGPTVTADVVIPNAVAADAKPYK